MSECGFIFVSQHAAREEILANGGSLSHHHGGNTNLKIPRFLDYNLWKRHRGCACSTSVLLHAGEQAERRTINAHLAGDLSLLPSSVQNMFPRLRWIALTRLFVHFCGDQMKREQREGGVANSPGPIRANRNGCLVYIAIRLAVFIHHFRLFITAVKNSMQWISCDIKSQFFLKAGTGSKLKDC